MNTLALLRDRIIARRPPNTQVLIGHRDKILPNRLEPLSDIEIAIEKYVRIEENQGFRMQHLLNVMYLDLSAQRLASETLESFCDQLPQLESLIIQDPSRPERPKMFLNVGVRLLSLKVDKVADLNSFCKNSRIQGKSVAILCLRARDLSTTENVEYLTLPVIKSLPSLRALTVAANWRITHFTHAGADSVDLSQLKVLRLPCAVVSIHALAESNLKHVYAIQVFELSIDHVEADPLPAFRRLLTEATALRVFNARLPAPVEHKLLEGMLSEPQMFRRSLIILLLSQQVLAREALLDLRHESSFLTDADDVCCLAGLYDEVIGADAYVFSETDMMISTLFASFMGRTGDYEAAVFAYTAIIAFPQPDEFNQIYVPLLARFLRAQIVLDAKFATSDVFSIELRQECENDMHDCVRKGLIEASLFVTDVTTKYFGKDSKEAQVAQLRTIFSFGTIYGLANWMPYAMSNLSDATTMPNVFLEIPGTAI